MTARGVNLKSPGRENRLPGSVRGASGNRHPYLDASVGGAGVGRGQSVASGWGLGEPGWVWSVQRTAGDGPEPKGGRARPGIYSIERACSRSAAETGRFARAGWGLR